MTRRIENLHPAAREKCLKLIRLAGERGIGLLLTSTLRTEAEQLALFVQGRKTLTTVNELRKEAGLSPINESANRIVTYALTSAHQFGLAFDIAIVTAPLKPVWDVKADLNGNRIADYEEVGTIGESLGLKWGGRFKRPDYCHFEFTGGLTVMELREGKRPAIGPIHPPLSFLNGDSVPIPRQRGAAPLNLSKKKEESRCYPERRPT